MSIEDYTILVVKDKQQKRGFYMETGTKKIMDYMFTRANNKLKKCYETLMAVEDK